MVFSKIGIGSPLLRQLENTLRMLSGTSRLAIVPLSNTIGKDACAARKRSKS